MRTLTTGSSSRYRWHLAAAVPLLAAMAVWWGRSRLIENTIIKTVGGVQILGSNDELYIFLQVSSGVGAKLCSCHLDPVLKDTKFTSSEATGRRAESPIRASSNHHGFYVHVSYIMPHDGTFYAMAAGSAPFCPMPYKWNGSDFVLLGLSERNQLLQSINADVETPGESRKGWRNQLRSLVGSCCSKRKLLSVPRIGNYEVQGVHPYRSSGSKSGCCHRSVKGSGASTHFPS